MTAENQSAEKVDSVSLHDRIYEVLTNWLGSGITYQLFLDDLDDAGLMIVQRDIIPVPDRREDDGDEQ